MKKLYVLGFIGQWLGLICSLCGVFLLAYLVTNPAAVFISVGSLTWGLGTKLKYYGALRVLEKEKGKKISIDELLNDHNIIPYKREN